MRVSREQADQNRQTVIDTASRLFREHGFDGIGLKDLMHEAGLTQGAFYKQFDSKDDLIAQASERGLETALNRWQRISGSSPDDPLRAVVDFYLSAGHRDQRMEGCPVVALGGDAARKGPEVKAQFEVGIREYLAILTDWMDSQGQPHALATLATMVGALVLSRAVNDTTLANDLLTAAHDSILDSRPPKAGGT